MHTYLYPHTHTKWTIENSWKLAARCMACDAYENSLELLCVNRSDDMQLKKHYSRSVCARSFLAFTLLLPPSASRLICFVLFFQISDYGNCWQIVLHLDFLLFSILVWFLPFRPHPIHALRRMLYVLWYSALALWLHTACSSLHVSFSAPSNGFLFILIPSTKRQCHIRHCYFDFTSSFFVVVLVCGSCFLNFFHPHTCHV